jgi:UDP-N-acetylmuramyl tripeptide synthase
MQLSSSKVLVFICQNLLCAVVGCGGDRDRGKRPIMAKIATDKSDVCIFTSDNPRTEEPCKSSTLPSKLAHSWRSLSC